jgi:hypothetical protein
MNHSTRNTNHNLHSLVSPFLQLLLARLACAKRRIRRIPRNPGGKIEREDAVAAIQRVYRFHRKFSHPYVDDVLFSVPYLVLYL